MLKICVATLCFFLNAAFALANPQRVRDGVVYLNLMSEASTLDPGMQLDSLSSFWLGHLYEGLATYDKKNQIVLAQAKDLQVAKDGLVYTFTLRPEARWHDNKPVLAEDYVFAWRRLVDPKYASTYSFIAESAQIKNAASVIAGKLPSTELGVKAVGDDKLIVELEHPVPAFLSMMALNPFFPVRKDVVEKYKDKFGIDAQSIMGNGPFKLQEWILEKSLRIVKAPTYWNSKNIFINEIAMPILVKDARSTYMLFETDGVDFVDQLDSESLGLAQKKRYKIHTAQSGIVWFMLLNTRPGRLFSSKNMRQALNLGLNRNEYINRILGLPGRRPAAGLVPPIIAGYRKIHPFPPAKYELKKAQALAKNEPLLKSIPSISLLATAAMGTEIQAYFQQEIKKALGIEVKSQAAPFKVRQQKVQEGDFDIAFSSWIPDYDDPMTYLDIFMSSSSANNVGFKSAEYDALIQQARLLSNKKLRFEKLFTAEKLLLAEAPLIPIEFSARAYLTQTNLQGVLRRVFGPDPDFRFAKYLK